MLAVSGPRGNFGYNRRMIDDSALRTKLREIYRKPTPIEARAIVDVARLAAAADRKSDLVETTALIKIAQTVFDMAGVNDVPTPKYAIDARRLLEIGEMLVPIGARELAFACGFLVMISDLELTKEESELAGKLGDALVLEPQRAQQLSAQMYELARG